MTLEDTQALQTDLDSIYGWAEQNNMMFNFEMFECLRYGRNSELKTSTGYRTMSGDQITVVDHAKDLEVTMSSDGTFRQHIYNLTDTGLKLAGWVLRTFRTRHKVPMLTLWKSLILSKLDYCSQLWNPSQTGEIQALEQVQRYFVRRISGIHHLNYWQQLRALSLYSLERRRERYMTIYVWRILEGQVPNLADPDTGGITANWHIRRGPKLSCFPSEHSSSSIHTEAEGLQFSHPWTQAFQHTTRCHQKQDWLHCGRIQERRRQIFGDCTRRTADTRLYCYEESWVKQSHSYGTVHDCPTKDIVGGAAWYVCSWRRPFMVTLGLYPETTTSIHK